MGAKTYTRGASFYTVTQEWVLLVLLGNNPPPPPPRTPCNPPSPPQPTLHYSQLDELIKLLSFI